MWKPTKVGAVASSLGSNFKNTGNILKASFESSKIHSIEENNMIEFIDRQVDKELQEVSVKT